MGRLRRNISSSWITWIPAESRGIVPVVGYFVRIKRFLFCRLFWGIFLFKRNPDYNTYLNSSLHLFLRIPNILSHPKTDKFYFLLSIFWCFKFSFLVLLFDLIIFFTSVFSFFIYVSNCNTRQNDRCLFLSFFALSLTNLRKEPSSATCCDPDFKFFCSKYNFLFISSHFASPFLSRIQFHLLIDFPPPSLGIFVLFW